VVLAVLLLVAVAVVVAVHGVASGRISVDPLAPAVGTTPATGLSEVPTSEDVDVVRFDTAARGYAMPHVDARLDELKEQLADRERELAGHGAGEMVGEG
jgi:DivIVA domain-containing protein